MTAKSEEGELVESKQYACTPPKGAELEGEGLGTFVALFGTPPRLLDLMLILFFAGI
jgi:hypothetical protein